MSLATANGIPVVSANLCLPRQGAWHADLLVAEGDVDKLNGAIELAIEGGDTWKGTFLRGTPYRGAVRLRMVAGKGGLAKDAKPQLRQRSQARAVVGAILEAGGEQLASSAHAATLATVFPRYQTIAQPVGYALETLVSLLDVTWRMLPDGSVWLGPEEWADGDLGDAVESDRDPVMGVTTWDVVAPTLRPGTTVEGLHVSYVQHRIASTGARTKAWFDDAASAGPDRLKATITSLVQSALPRLDYQAIYRAEVRAQSADLSTLDVKCDDVRLGDMPALPLRHGLPAAKVQVSAGAHVLVGFIGGDPRLPYVHAWEGGEGVTKAVLKADTLHLGDETGSQFVALANLVSDQLTTLKNAISSAIPTAQDGGAALKTGIMTALNTANWPASMAANNVKAK